MANYALIENNEIAGLYDSLPTRWKNISNMHVLSDEEVYPYGWRKIIKPGPEYDSATQYVGLIDYYLLGDNVYERYQILEIPVIPAPIPPTPEEIANQILEQWTLVRKTRDEKMGEFEWRYSRYDRQIRLGLPTTDTLADMDAYMQALADITNQTDPYNIVWPEYVG